VYKFFNRFVSSDLESLRPASGGLGGDDEEGPVAVTMEGTAACVAAPDPLLLVSASLSSDPEESPPMSKSSMRPIVALLFQQKKRCADKKSEKVQGKTTRGLFATRKRVKTWYPAIIPGDTKPPFPHDDWRASRLPHPTTPPTPPIQIVPSIRTPQRSLASTTIL
jgi:hypothetical protein